MTHHEFPDVVELNVGGIHYTTHLSTLTKYEDSSLAAMFTGRAPVFKDKDGRYFVDADGNLFKNILEYLITDVLPFFDHQTSTFGFGGGGGGGLFGTSPARAPYSDRQILLFHREAKQFGLKALSDYIEKHRAAFFEKRLDDYRVSKRGYDECMSKILNKLTIGALFENPFVIVRLCQDLVTDEENKCCKHNCVGGLEQNNVADPFCYDDVYRTVKIPFEIDPILLNCICIDMQRFGFNATGRIAECQFICKKAQRNQFGFSFGFNNQCCKKVLYLIQFHNIVQERYVEIYRTQMHINEKQIRPTFGLTKGVGSQQVLGKPFGGTMFGQNQAQVQKSAGFGFGAANNTCQSSGFGGFGMSNDNNVQQAFSGNQNSQSLFGNQNQNITQTQQGFQNPGECKQSFSFAAPSGSSKLFGSAQTQPVGTSSNAFGSSTGKFAFGQQSTFGALGGFGKSSGNQSSSFSFGCSNATANPGQMPDAKAKTAEGEERNAATFSFNSGSNMANAMDGLKLTADQLPSDSDHAANTGNTFGNATSVGQQVFGLKCQKFGSG